LLLVLTIGFLSPLL
jgi:hypothetical protein